MISYVENLKQRYLSNGVILDSNLLIVFMLGSLGYNLERQKRTQKYTNEFYSFLKNYLAGFDSIHTTPQILTEVFNLVEPEQLKTKEIEKIQNMFEKYIETFTRSTELMIHDCFYKFQLTDTSIVKLAQDKNLLVLTDDSRLYSMFNTLSIDYINIGKILAEIYIYR